MGYDEYTHGIYGDIRYRAPEVIRGQYYGFKADSWSFGVILFLFILSITQARTKNTPEYAGVFVLSVFKLRKHKNVKNTLYRYSDHS